MSQTQSLFNRVRVVKNSITLYAILIAIIIVHTACIDNIIDSFTPEIPPLLPRLSLDDIGRLHNEALRDIEKNFDTNVVYSSAGEFENACRDHLYNWQIEQINHTDSQRELLFQLYDSYKVLVHQDTILSLLSDVSIADEAGLLAEQGELDAIELEILLQTLTVSLDLLDKTNDDGLVAADDYHSAIAELENLKSSWNQQFGKGTTIQSDAKPGQLAGVVLTIVSYSSRFWLPDSSDKIEYLSPLAIIDGLGGLFGGFRSARRQHRENGEIDWAVVGGSALAGAASASGAYLFNVNQPAW